MHRILIVDDEGDVLELAKIILESSGYDVLTATNGEEALNIVSQSKPDLVLLDAVMPDIHGLDVCRRLKRSKETRNIPVLIFSALGPEVDLMLSDGEKADGYLGKPFSNKMLLEKVERLLNQ